MIVVKCGGAVSGMAAAEIEALAALEPVVVVHGAGPQISRAMADAGLTVTFVRGRRVTDGAALEVVREALLDVNRALCDALGARAVGLVRRRDRAPGDARARARAASARPSRAGHRPCSTRSPPA